MYNIMEVHQLESYLEDKYGVTLDLYDNVDHMVLSRIVVPKSERGRDIGSKVLEEIGDYADKNDLKVYLTPAKDFGASSLARLKNFYKKFGFKNKDRSDFSTKESMVRYPNA